MSKALQHRKRHSVTTQNRIPITSTLTGLVTLFRLEGVRVWRILLVSR